MKYHQTRVSAELLVLESAGDSRSSRVGKKKVPTKVCKGVVRGSTDGNPPLLALLSCTYTKTWWRGWQSSFFHPQSKCF